MTGMNRYACRVPLHIIPNTNNQQQKHMQILSDESSDKIDAVTCACDRIMDIVILIEILTSAFISQSTEP